MRLGFCQLSAIVDSPTTVLASGGESAISSVRILGEGHRCVPSVLYLLDSTHADRLLCQPGDWNLSFCIILHGEDSLPEQPFPGERWDVICIRSALPFEEEAERILDNFSDLSSWHDDLIEAPFSDSGLSRFLDIAATRFANPIALFDLSSAPIAWAGTVPEDADDPVWNDVLRGTLERHIPEEGQALFNRAIRTPGARIYPPLTQEDAFHYMQTTVFVGDRPIATLSMDEVSRPFAKRDPVLLQIAAELLGRAPALFGELAISQNTTSSVFAQLSSGIPLAGVKLEAFIRDQGLLEQSPYRVYAFCTEKRSQLDDRSHQAYSNRLRAIEPELRIFYYDGMLIGILQRSGNALPELARGGALERMDLLAGCSMHYRGYAFLHLALAQARAALSFSSEGKRASDYRSIQYEHVERALSSEGPLSHYCHPALLRLCDGSPWHRELLITTLMFLRNGCRISATANQLHIHRNTMVYRLGCLAKALGFALEELDGDERRFVLMSAELLCSAIEGGVAAT